MISQLTSHQYYRGLNRRFDKRSKRLHQMGFRCVVTEFGAFFQKVWYGNKTYNIPTSLVMNAHQRVFIDKIKSYRF